MLFCKREVNAGLGIGHKCVIARNAKHFDKNAFLGAISPMENCKSYPHIYRRSKKHKN